MKGLINLIGIVATLYKDDDVSEEYTRKGLLGGLFEYTDKIFTAHGFIKKEPKPISSITKFYYTSLKGEVIMCLATDGNWRFKDYGNAHLLLWFDKINDAYYNVLKSDLDLKLPPHHSPLELEIMNLQKAEQLKSYFLDPAKFPLMTKGESQ